MESTEVKKCFDEAILSVQDLGKFLETQEQVDTPITHSIFGGIYTRAMFIPEGTLIIGKRHRNATCNMLMQGTISIYMGKDLPVRTLIGPCVFPSAPYSQKLGYAHTDVIFMTVHPTEEIDVNKMEEILTIPEEEYIEIYEIETNEITQSHVNDMHSSRLEALKEKMNK